MIDLGADWSMLDFSALTGEERQQLITDSQMVGQEVSKEPIVFVGEVWMDVQLGRVTLPKQSFVVLRNLVTAAILSDLTLNFGKRCIEILRLGIKLELFETDTIPKERPAN